MPDNDHNARDRAHVSIDRLCETKKFKAPTSPQSRKALREDYAAHASLLLNQLAAIFATGAPTPAVPRLQVDMLKPGTLVEVATKPPESARAKAQKMPQGLEFPAEQIVILRSERVEDRTERALLFVPDDAQAFLRGRLTQYGREPGNNERPDLERFEAVETFQSVAPARLFVGRVDFAVPEASWWELWVSGGARRVDSIAGHARAARLDVHADRLVFPDTTVLFIHAAPAALLRFVAQIPGAVAEIRSATGTIEPFLDQREGRVGQQDFVAELAGRLVPPPADAPAVCVLDTGVSAAHPLLQPGLRGAWSYRDAWGVDDHHGWGGHGTPLTGLALHGDLEPLLNSTGEVILTHDAESMKLLPPRGFPTTEPAAWGIVTQGAVALTETERPGILRSYCLATTAPFFPPREPSSWSGALDQIAAGAMPGERTGDEDEAPQRRLVLVATGNRDGGQRADVEVLQPLEDPAQSWNALSVGGFTRKDQPAAGMTPVVAANHRSPFSLGSHMLPYDLTPIKPEVLFEAGNMLADGMGFCAWHEGVSLLAPGSDVAGEPLVPFYATSAAVGMAGHFTGRLQAALPTLWPETHRALAIDSAAWTQPMLERVISRGAHWKGGKHGTVAKRQAFLREFGYGVPDLERALQSARNDVTLLAQAEIQPFTTGADRRSGVFNEMHFYRLPWPRIALQELEDEVVTMKVTLSYFIEPNLTGRAATRPDTYRSFGLRFAMKKRSESEPHFRGRINADQAKDGTPVEEESSRWLLGPKAVQAGSLHCDVWRGRAVELAGHDGIGIFPVSGWWKSHIGQRRMEAKARYALAISISAPGLAVDLHAEVLAEIEARIQADIEVPGT